MLTPIDNRLNLSHNISFGHGENQGFFDTMQGMIRYTRMWRLVVFVDKKTLTRKPTPPDQVDEIVKKMMLGYKPAISLEWFLKNYDNNREATLSLLGDAKDKGFLEELDYPLPEGNIRMLRTTVKGYRFAGFSDFMQGLLNEYDSYWTKIIIPLISFLAGVGLYYLPSFIKTIYLDMGEALLRIWH